MVTIKADQMEARTDECVGTTKECCEEDRR